ncbi:helix-turn-helix transcriptional regulator [Lacrimispora sp.]|uniref:helix-turn-helix transcriptional regulator n=1 Tax=Lacrimispora sp. TaxID=2719234 RepID=UPI003995106B
MGPSKESTKKHDRVLEIYSRLLSGEIIRKQDLADEYKVTPRSIQRDIDSIRDFYSNRIGKNEGLAEIKYDRIAKGFRIVSNKTITLTNAELFAVAKIILESRSLSKHEVEKIIADLIEACLPVGERRKMEELVRNEMFHYIEPQHGKNLIDTIWELGSAVYTHRMVQIEYKKTSGDTSHSKIKPVGIMGSEYYFYLIAYIGDKDKKYPGYPTIYRIDRIISYKVTEESFHVPYRDRFEEGEFRKRIPFMYTGKLHKTSFIYTGTDINAVLDRLPSATAKKLEDGNYLVMVEVYGEKGLELWLKGQGAYTVVNE